MPTAAATWKKAQRFFPLTYKRATPSRTLDLGKMVTFPPGYFPTNPAILKVAGGFLICVRGVNYTLKDSRSMAAEFTQGGGFSTLNRFLLASPDFATTISLPHLDEAFAEVEDVKLFALGNDVFGIGSRVTDRGDNSCRITLGHIAPDFSGAAFRDIPSPFGIRQEKNWSPFSSDGRLYFVYSYHPLVILHYRFDLGRVEFCQPDQARYSPSALPFLVCGSSPGLEIQSGFLFVAHRRSVRLPNLNRAYVSRLYRLDRGMSAVAAGRYFVIERPSIQFVNGLTMDEQSIFISYGNNDNSAHLACFPRDKFLMSVA